MLHLLNQNLLEMHSMNLLGILQNVGTKRVDL